MTPRCGFSVRGAVRPRALSSVILQPALEVRLRRTVFAYQLRTARDPDRPICTGTYGKTVHGQLDAHRPPTDTAASSQTCRSLRYPRPPGGPEGLRDERAGAPLSLGCEVSRRR